MNTENDLIHRLRTRAGIRRSIPTRKSVQNGEPDRIADLLEEAADRIAELEKQLNLHKNAHHKAVELLQSQTKEQD